MPPGRAAAQGIPVQRPPVNAANVTQRRAPTGRLAVSKPYPNYVNTDPSSLAPGTLRTSISGAYMTSIKIIVEKHQDGYVAYPLGLSGAVVGQGDSYEAALADVRSAVEFHIETFGADATIAG